MAYNFSYRFTEKAEQDLDEILRYISVDLVNPTAAQNLGRKVFGKIVMVRTFPESGAPVDNEFLADKTVHKLSVDNYVIYSKAHYEEKVIPHCISIFKSLSAMRILTKITTLW